MVFPQHTLFSDFIYITPFHELTKNPRLFLIILKNTFAVGDMFLVGALEKKCRL